mgnify:CR=1 FL=1
MNKALVDTNVLIYAYSSTELNKKQASLEILSSNNIMLNTQVINEFIWIMTKKFSVDLKVLTMIIKNLFDSYRIEIIEKETIIKAMSISSRYGYTHWDSLILANALLNNCRTVFTEDMQHKQIIEGKVQIINPYKE